ncbi:MAG: ATP-binding protein [Anaerolineae bacterium]
MYIRNGVSGLPEIIELAALISPANAPALLPEGKFTYQIASSTMSARLQSSLYQMSVIADIDKEQEYITEEQRQMIRQLGVRSFAVIPLNLHEKWIGIVAMAWNTPREFKLDERQYYETMAPQFAAALESLLLFQEIETALNENHRLLMEASYNEDLLRRFVEHMPLAIAMFDTDMRYLVANRRWQMSYKLGDIDIIGRSHYEVFPEITERWKELHRRCLAGEILHHEADPFERADGTIDWIRWEIRPWFTFDGKVGGIIMYTEVINERIRQQKEREAFIAELRVANQKATEASRMKSEFLATMSHELRTPLNTIIGFSGIMLEGIAGSFDDTTRHMINAIYESGENLLGLINDLLDISKIEAGWFELVPLPIDISRMVATWEASLQGYSAKKNLNSRALIADNLPQTLIGDHDRITQIVNNLLSNAFKFTESGEVTLAVRWEEKTFIIEVSDTGIGIPEEALAYIFEAFRQVDSSTRRRYGGTGLGLSIVRRLVEAMNGWIKVHTKLNEGSMFKVSLPLQER